jgi:cytochrome c
MEAVAKNRPEFITLLLAHGADPNSTAGKQTPSMWPSRKAASTASRRWSKRALMSTPEQRIPSRGHRSILPDFTSIPRSPTILWRMASCCRSQARLPRNWLWPMSRRAGFFSAKIVTVATTKNQARAASMVRICGRSSVATGHRRRNSIIPKSCGIGKACATYEHLNTFLYGPVLTTPGMRMETPGAPDETERVNLIAYLRTLSDKPIPLP